MSPHLAAPVILTNVGTLVVVAVAPRHVVGSLVGPGPGSEGRAGGGQVVGSRRRKVVVLCLVSLPPVLAYTLVPTSTSCSSSSGRTVTFWS